MATHSDDRSQFNRLTTQSLYQNEERELYTGSPLAKPHIHAGSLYKSHIHTHALSQNARRVYLGKLSFGPRYLVHGILIHGIGPRYLVRGIDPRYLVQGIGPKWFCSMVLRKA